MCLVACLANRPAHADEPRDRRVAKAAAEPERAGSQNHSCGQGRGCAPSEPPVSATAFSFASKQQSGESGAPRPDQQRRPASPGWLLTQAKRKPPSAGRAAARRLLVCTIRASLRRRSGRPPLSDTGSESVGGAAAALLLAGSVVWLAPGVSSSRAECSRSPCSLPAQLRGVAVWRETLVADTKRVFWTVGAVTRGGAGWWVTPRRAVS